MAMETTSTLSNLVSQYYDKKLLMNFYPNLVLYSLAQKRPIPKGSGSTINFHKIAKLSSVTTPLVEGVAPAEGSLTATRPSAVRCCASAGPGTPSSATTGAPSRRRGDWRPSSSCPPATSICCGSTRRTTSPLPTTVRRICFPRPREPTPDASSSR